MARCPTGSRPGAFYGGWITSAVTGPFNGEAGTPVFGEANRYRGSASISFATASALSSPSAGMTATGGLSPNLAFTASAT